MKYTEIFKLKEMLEEAKIPFEYEDESMPVEFIIDGKWEKYHICYPAFDKTRVCSIVQGRGTYGNENDLLEIMGLLTDKERKWGDSVAGHLTAEDVFNRIKNHYAITCEELNKGGNNE